jgi:DNA-binding PadR family transcriptional regulator
MGVKEGLLCLLARGDAHGYELKTELEETSGHTWQINIGQIYTTLQRLERDGLVRSSAATEEGRIIYSLTEEGRHAAATWMSRPVDLAVAGRDEISLKILMAMRSGVEDPRRVIEIQRGATMGLLQDYTTLKAAEDSNDLAWLLHLDRLIFSAEAELRWLDRVEDRLETLPPAALPQPDGSSQSSVEVAR